MSPGARLTRLLLRAGGTRACAGVLGALVATGAFANVTVRDAWVRGTVPGQDSTGAYMQLEASADAALVGARSPAAKAVELHSMRMDGGMMKMRPVSRLPLPAGQRVDLGASGYHLMLTGVTQPIRARQTVPITLVIEDAQGRRSEVLVSALVRPLGATGQAPETHDATGHSH